LSILLLCLMYHLFAESHYVLCFLTSPLAFRSNLSGSLTHYAMGASYIYHGPFWVWDDGVIIEQFLGMYYLTTRRFLTVGILVSVFFLGTFDISLLSRLFLSTPSFPQLCGSVRVCCTGMRWAPFDLQISTLVPNKRPIS